MTPLWMYILLLLPSATICGSAKKFLDLFPADYDKRTAPPLINEGKTHHTGPKFIFPRKKFDFWTNFNYLKIHFFGGCFAPVYKQKFITLRCFRLHYIAVFWKHLFKWLIFLISKKRRTLFWKSSLSFLLAFILTNVFPLSLSGQPNDIKVALDVSNIPHLDEKNEVKGS